MPHPDQALLVRGVWDKLYIQGVIQEARKDTIAKTVREIRMAQAEEEEERACTFRPKTTPLPGLWFGDGGAGEGEKGRGAKSVFERLRVRSPQVGKDGSGPNGKGNEPQRTPFDLYNGFISGLRQPSNRGRSGSRSASAGKQRGHSGASQSNRAPSGGGGQSRSCSASGGAKKDPGVIARLQKAAVDDAANRERLREEFLKKRCTFKPFAVPVDPKLGRPEDEVIKERREHTKQLAEKWQARHEEELRVRQEEEQRRREAAKAKEERLRRQQQEAAGKPTQAVSPVLTVNQRKMAAQRARQEEEEKARREKKALEKKLSQEELAAQRRPTESFKAKLKSNSPSRSRSPPAKKGLPATSKVQTAHSTHQGSGQDAAEPDSMPRKRLQDEFDQSPREGQQNQETAGGSRQLHQEEDDTFDEVDDQQRRNQKQLSYPHRRVLTPPAHREPQQRHQRPPDLRSTIQTPRVPAPLQDHPSSSYAAVPQRRRSPQSTMPTRRSEGLEARDPNGIRSSGKALPGPAPVARSSNGRPSGQGRPSRNSYNDPMHPPQLQAVEAVNDDGEFAEVLDDADAGAGGEGAPVPSSSTRGGAYPAQQQQSPTRRTVGGILLPFDVAGDDPLDADDW
jgi:hypothetical protein